MSTDYATAGDQHGVEQRMVARTLVAVQSALSIAELIARAAADPQWSEPVLLNNATEQLERVLPVVESLADLPLSLQRAGQVAAADVALLISQLRVIIPHET